jgi:hypothetical protein
MGEDKLCKLDEISVRCNTRERAVDIRFADHWWFERLKEIGTRDMEFMSWREGSPLYVLKAEDIMVRDFLESNQQINTLEVRARPRLTKRIEGMFFGNKLAKSVYAGGVNEANPPIGLDNGTLVGTVELTVGAIGGGGELVGAVDINFTANITGVYAVDDLIFSEQNPTEVMRVTHVGNVNNDRITVVRAHKGVAVALTDGSLMHKVTLGVSLADWGGTNDVADVLVFKGGNAVLNGNTEWVRTELGGQEPNTYLCAPRDAAGAIIHANSNRMKISVTPLSNDITRKVIAVDTHFRYLPTGTLSVANNQRIVTLKQNSVVYGQVVAGLYRLGADSEWVQLDTTIPDGNQAGNITHVHGTLNETAATVPLIQLESTFEDLRTNGVDCRLRVVPVYLNRSMTLYKDGRVPTVQRNEVQVQGRSGMSFPNSVPGMIPR